MGNSAPQQQFGSHPPPPAQPADRFSGAQPQNSHQQYGNQHQQYGAAPSLQQPVHNFPHGNARAPPPPAPAAYAAPPPPAAAPTTPKDVHEVYITLGKTLTGEESEPIRLKHADKEQLTVKRLRGALVNADPFKAGQSRLKYYHKDNMVLFLKNYKGHNDPLEEDDNLFDWAKRARTQREHQAKEKGESIAPNLLQKETLALNGMFGSTPTMLQ